MQESIKVNSKKLTAHLQQDRYGDFWLTDAIRPSLQHQIIPRQGYRLETYRDASKTIQVPVLAAAVSRERLFDVFLDLLDALGDVVDVVLETSHDSDGTAHRDLHRSRIDLPILQSHLYDFEDLLLHDGCTGIAVLSATQPIEVQFDEHKLLVVYAEDLRPFEETMLAFDVERDDTLSLITEGEHLHNTNPKYVDQFDALCYRLGVGEHAEPVNW